MTGTVRARQPAMPGYGSCVRVSAKVDYALRAMLELAAAGGLVKGEQLATAQGIPQKFLESILIDLRHAELVASRRGVEGGYSLARPADEISLADVIRAVEGPIATVRGARPEEVEYVGAAAGLRPLWLDLRAAMRGVLEDATLADVVARRGA
jgi:Rrf2 family protein